MTNDDHIEPQRGPKRPARRKPEARAADSGCRSDEYFLDCYVRLFFQSSSAADEAFRLAEEKTDQVKFRWLMVAQNCVDGCLNLQAKIDAIYAARLKN